jgi:hypothetical protein
MIGWDGRQFGEGHHAQTLRLPPTVGEAAERVKRGM